MGQHGFSMDPRAILGVSPSASLEEIQDAYRAKSKKHHPDVGGDEWAFRMVARAYEVLKRTTDTPAGSRPWDQPAATGTPPVRPTPWTWVGNSRGTAWAGATSASATEESTFAHGDRAEQTTDADDDGADSNPDSPVEETPPTEPNGLRTVNVELIWTRFEFENASSGRSMFPPSDDDDATLSVCMVISWPPHALVEDAARFASTAETLRIVIDRFEQLRSQGAVVAARSRIEDGRFVGWLSYPDVLRAQDDFLKLRDDFKSQGLSVKLQTRDERVPFEGHGRFHPTVMSQAS